MGFFYVFQVVVVLLVLVVVYTDSAAVCFAKVKAEVLVHLIDRSKNRNFLKKKNQIIEPLVDVELVVVFDKFVLAVMHPVV
jgi:hypothetical protein